MCRAQGTVLFRRGDEGKGVFIVLSGTVSLDFGV
jgi:CRP-like cAMP-binding protein